MNQTEQKKPLGGDNESGYQDANDTFNVNIPSPYKNIVHKIMWYYMALVTLSLLLLTDTVWDGHNFFLELIGFCKVPYYHLMRTVIFVATGALLGNVLYQIRQLYKAYCKPRTPEESFNPRWVGKYYSSPWEALVLALIVVGLIGGNEYNPDGSFNYPRSDLSSFSAFGLGGLIGFGIREVVGWLGDLTTTIFPTKNKTEVHPVEKDEKLYKGKDK